MDIEFYKKLATEDLNTLPYVPLESRNELPVQSAIYFAIDSQENIQYIGRSVNLRQRWQNHHKLKKLNSIGNIRVAYLSLDADLLDSVESALIDHFNPPLNNICRLQPKAESDAQEKEGNKKINFVLPSGYGRFIEEFAQVTGDTVANISQRAVIAYLNNIVDKDLLKKLNKKD